jgi:hypothetical protein
LDFGLAKASSEKRRERELTGSGAMLGTPDYMAPEQILDAAKADIRADIYSLGCTLYYLLSGGPPFKADSLYQLLYAHQTVEAPLLHKVRPEVPAKLSLVVAQMMAKQPSERYQTPGEVAMALASFVRKDGASTTQSVSVAGSSASRIQKPGDKAKQKRPMPEPETPGAWKSLTENQDTASQPRQSVARQQKLPARKTAAKKKWLLAAGVVMGLLLLGGLGLLASGVLRVKTPEGILVMEVNEPDAEIFVDGDKVTVTWSKEGKAEVGVKPGTHKVEVKKDGFVATGEEVEIESGGRKLLRAHLEPGVAAAARQPGLSFRPLIRMALVRTGQWHTEGTRLLQDDATTPFPDILFGEFEWTDYDFSVHASRIEGNVDYFALFGRWFDGNGLKYQPSSAGNGVVQLLSLDQANWTTVQESHVRVPNDGLYKTILRVRGNRYQGIINNQVITDYVDPVNACPQGRVGLGTNKAVYRFTNIEVRSRMGKLLWTGPPDLEPPKPAAVDQPTAVGLELLEQAAPKPGAPASSAPRRTLEPGAVLVGAIQLDSGGLNAARIEISERADDVFKGSITWDGFFGMRTFALAGTLRGTEVKWEVGNVLVKQGKLGAPAANNQSLAGRFERGTLEGRISSHDGKSTGGIKLNLAAVYTGTYQFATGTGAKGALRIEITERQENHFKGTLTSDDGPTTWVITGTAANGEVQWQWGDMACKDGCNSEKLTNNCGFTGTCKEGIVQGRFSTLDKAQTGTLRATLVGPRSALGKE